MHPSVTSDPGDVVRVDRPDRRWAALVVLCVAQFMLIVDLMVVQVALPSIGADLLLDRELLTWVVTAYIVCFGGLMLLGGRLADTFGARRVLMAGLAVFIVASLICGLADSPAALIGGRAAQGVGAALVSPAALSTITRMFHGAERNRALGVWAGIGGSGAAVGVVMGGLLTAGPGWSWVFFVNVPVGLAVMVALPLLVPAVASRRARVDLPGALTVTSGTALLVYGLTRAGESGWFGVGVLVPVGLAGVAYAAFAVIERVTAEPLMRVSMLTRRPVQAGTFVMLVGTGMLASFFFLTSLYLQQVRGFDALRTGLVLLPVAVVVTVGAHLAGRLIGRVGARMVAAGGFTLLAVGAGLLLVQVGGGANPYAVVLPGFLVASLGIGPTFVAATSTALGYVRQDESGLASAVVSTAHELGGAIGVSVVSAVAAGSIAADISGTSGFRAAFALCAVVAVVAAAVALKLVPPGRPVGAAVGHGHGHVH